MNPSKLYGPLFLALHNFENLVGLHTVSLTVDSCSGLLGRGIGEAENSLVFFAVPVVSVINSILPLHREVFLMGLIKFLFIDLSNGSVFSSS
jgi:hypothetical protein